jgi:hypothetical protein
MKKVYFIRMVEITEEKDMDELEIGDFFLYGQNLIAQKQNKIPGDGISYFQIVDKKSKGNVEYAPIFDILEQDKGE